MAVTLLVFLGLIQLATSQLVSPCPDVLQYETRTKKTDQWYGVLSLRSSEDLIGVWITILFDRQVELLGNWFGEATSTDNKEFSIINQKYRLEAGPPISVRFFVKYRPGKQVPNVVSIRLNGKNICEDAAQSLTPVLHISHTKPTTKPNGGYNSSRPSTSDSGTGWNRPTNTGSGINRPSNGDNSDAIGSVDETGTSGTTWNRPTNAGSGSGTTNWNRPSNGGTGGVIGSDDDTDTSGTIWDRPTNSNGGGSTSNWNRPSTSGGNAARPGTNSERPYRPGTGSGTSQPIGLTDNHHTGTTDNEGTDDKGNNLSFDTNGRPVFVDTGSTSTNSVNNGQSSGGTSSGSDEDYFPGDFAGSNANNVNSHAPSASSKTEACGVVSATSSVRPLIANGQDTIPGQWPWHAALYHSKGIQLTYSCGGTLISQRHVLTAAHCVTRPRTNKQVNKKGLLVYLGKYNLNTFGPEVQDSVLEKIYVHPEYNATSYFNDIAILKLAKEVKITDYVRPSCLWEGNSDLSGIIDYAGTVVGWGFDENRNISNKLMQAQMPVVSTVTCIYSNRDFFSQFTFDKNYCAGFRNGTTVCNGDSGGGMVFPKSSGQTVAWYLRGIVSVGVALQGEGVCDPSQYILFTDVAKYSRWIKQVLADEL